VAELHVLVPVKRLDDAKSRLAGALAPADRRALTLAMLGDVLAAVGRSRSVAWAARRRAMTTAGPGTRP
jgi:FO synthase